MCRCKLSPLCAVLLLAVVAGGCSAFRALKARDQLNKGVASYSNGKFQAAIEHFKNAIQLDPSLLNARLYLGTAYAQQYVPNGDAPENTKTGQQAIAAFENVLQKDPKNATALAFVGKLYAYMNNFDKAKEFQRRRIQCEPNNPEPYYWIGVIDWGLSQKNDAQVRKALSPKAMILDTKTGWYAPLPEKARGLLADENGKLVSEGLDALQKAIDLKPNDYATMDYINLMYRQKAEIDETNQARRADLKSAEQWFQKSQATQKIAPPP
jgi:tetratricopeptide (TPR) repeat protein